MDEVGERPWDRAFFRDTCLNLFEKGGCEDHRIRLWFHSKEHVKMVPLEKCLSERHGFGELIQKYPNRVVLGCLYSGVQTPFVKAVNSNAMPPLFSEGFSIDDSNFRYLNPHPIQSSISRKIGFWEEWVRLAFFPTSRWTMSRGGVLYGIRQVGKLMHTISLVVKGVCFHWSCQRKIKVQ